LLFYYCYYHINGEIKIYILIRENFDILDVIAEDTKPIGSDLYV